MMVESPAPERIPQLRQLWQEAFSDTEDFLDSFFEYGFSPDRCRCVVEEDKVLSALYWFEVSAGQQRFAYLYAVATAKRARGQGRFSALLSDVKGLLTAAGFDGILLHPADAGLARMYEKFGFRCCAAVDEHHVKAKKAAVTQDLAIREISAEAYAALRRGLLPQGAALPAGHWLPFLEKQYRFFEGEDFLALGQVYDGVFYAQEFLGNEEAMEPLLSALEVEEGSFRTVGESVPFIWCLPLTERCAPPSYFAIALD